MRAGDDGRAGRGRGRDHEARSDALFQNRASWRRLRKIAAQFLRSCGPRPADLRRRACSLVRSRRYSKLPMSSSIPAPTASSLSYRRVVPDRDGRTAVPPRAIRIACGDRRASHWARQRCGLLRSNSPDRGDRCGWFRRADNAAIVAVGICPERLQFARGLDRSATSPDSARGCHQAVRKDQSWSWRVHPAERGNRGAMAAGAAFGGARVLPFVIAVFSGGYVRSVRAQADPDGGGDVDFVGSSAFRAAQSELVSAFVVRFRLRSGCGQAQVLSTGSSPSSSRTAR